MKLTEPQKLVVLAGLRLLQDAWTPGEGVGGRAQNVMQKETDSAAARALVEDDDVMDELARSRWLCNGEGK